MYVDHSNIEDQILICTKGKKKKEKKSDLPGSLLSESRTSSVPSSVRILKDASDVLPGCVEIIPRNLVTPQDRT